MKEIKEVLDQEREIQNLKCEYESVKAPAEGLEQVKRRMDEALQAKKRKRTRFPFRFASAAAVAAMAAFLILPNTSSSIAYAMENLPLIGGLVKAVTFRSYEYADEGYEAKVEIPQITAEGAGAQTSPDILAANEEIADYTAQAIARFEEEISAGPEGHSGLNIDYETITDNEQWFTLKITALKVNASGYETARFYTIDKATGKIVSLQDLFETGVDYRTLLSNAIKADMRAQMSADSSKVYFIDQEEWVEEFQAIRPDQSFYINHEGQLVISFDEYEVAPGYMGRPEFVITDASVLSQMKKR